MSKFATLTVLEVIIASACKHLGSAMVESTLDPTEIVGGTGYIDTIYAEDFPAGVKAMHGKDKNGRPYITFLTNKGISTVFQRYTDNEDVIVAAGDRTLFTSCLKEDGQDVIWELITTGKCTVESWKPIAVELQAA